MDNLGSILLAVFILTGFAGMMIAFWIYCIKQIERHQKKKNNKKPRE